MSTALEQGFSKLTGRDQRASEEKTQGLCSLNPDFYFLAVLLEQVV